jgi:hypothetical protein
MNIYKTPISLIESYSPSDAHHGETKVQRAGAGARWGAVGFRLQALHEGAEGEGDERVVRACRVTRGGDCAKLFIPVHSIARSPEHVASDSLSALARASALALFITFAAL